MKKAVTSHAVPVHAGVARLHELRAAWDRAACRGFLLCALLFCLAIPPLEGLQQPNAMRTAETTLNAGIEAYQAGKLDQAIARVKEAYALAPRNPQVRLYLGLFLYEKTKDSLEAQRHMESVLEQFPSNTDLQLRLLDSYLRARNEAKSEALVQRLQARMAADGRFAFNVIYTLIHYGRFVAARRETEKISNTLQGEVLFIGGLIAVGSEEKTEAVNLLQAAGKHGFPPRNSPQMRTLADCYFRLGEFPLAARAYEAYIEHHPEPPPDLRFQLGLCYYSYGDFERALNQMLAVKQKAPETPEVNHQLGTILIELKRTDEARTYLEAELKMNPAFFKALTKLAYLEYLAGRDDACRRLLDKSLSLESSWFETHMVFGLLYNRLGDYQKAVESLEACIREEPEYPKAHFQLSWAYRRLGNEEKARQYQESFTRLQEAAVARAQKALGLVKQ